MTLKKGDGGADGTATAPGGHGGQDARSGGSWGAFFSVFLKERSPWIPVLVLAAAMTAAAQRVPDPGPFGVGFAAKLPAFLGGWIFAAAFLTLLRLMDEVKDVDKDRVVHPERPLARGLLSVGKARKAVLLGVGGLAAWGAAFWGLSAPGALGMVLTTLYSFAMYREFGLGPKLGRNLFVLALSHQLVVAPLYLSLTALAWPGRWGGTEALLYAGLALSCSFSYELSRKLDPAAHPLARNYVQVHGTGPTVLAILFCLVAASALATFLGFGRLIAPLALAQAFGLGLYWVRPWPLRRADPTSLAKFVEGLAVLTSLGQLVAPLVLAPSVDFWFLLFKNFIVSGVSR